MSVGFISLYVTFVRDLKPENIEILKNFVSHQDEDAELRSAETLENGVKIIIQVPLKRQSEIISKYKDKYHATIANEEETLDISKLDSSEDPKRTIYKVSAHPFSYLFLRNLKGVISVKPL